MMKQFALSHSLTLLNNNRRARAYFNRAKHPNTNVACLALIAMDISRFHQMYDRKNGKKMQKRVEEQLADFCGEFDFFGRMGEASFVVGLSCQNGFIAQKQINQLVDNLNQKESEYFDKSVTLFHAGLCFSSEEAEGFDTLMHNAFLAYNHACDHQVTLCVFTKDLLKSESYNNYLRDKLSNAIDDQQFEMFLQFIHNTEKGKFTCAEVLSRWNNPVEGFLMPAYYINDMRNTGVIKKFDMYMLEKTCCQLEKWNGGKFGELCLSCNITRITISAPDFVQHLHKILKKYKFDHSRLMLEITEDALIDKELARQNIIACKKDGIRIAIDDLCAGHSTLEDISDYPIDQVKLDRNVIVSAASERGSSFLNELIGMAHRLNIEVVCEGVETEEQLNIVLKDGCDYIQGYYYSYVLPMNEAKDYYLKSTG